VLPKNWSRRYESLRGRLGPARRGRAGAKIRKEALEVKRKRHSPEEIIRKLRDAEADLAGGLEVAQICQKLGISEATFHRWRNQYGGMKAEEMKRLKELQKENARLKRIVPVCVHRTGRADLELDKAILKEVVEGNY